jgi:hypothetical protein
LSSKRDAGKPSRKTRTVPPPLPEYLGFLAPFESRIAELALATRELVLEEAPDSTELIYDAYNAVATGYRFTGRPLAAPSSYEILIYRAACWPALFSAGTTFNCTVSCELSFTLTASAADSCGFTKSGSCCAPGSRSSQA